MDALSAAVTLDADVTTLACRSGAIATCMLWGYKPWDSPSEQPGRVREDLFASCLHAKRAAYFVGQGDFASYTRNGTRILVRDAYGIQGKGARLEQLEAVWGPQGAVCLNPENRRRPEVDLPTYPGVRPCTAAGLREGVLATGRLPIHAASR
ncbi:hypothetical protein JRI60_10210 [Archangium violaceum]|uniref:ADYC domain-containing protein n=1 Tax=Archangium violaceum TaxID=83451 RepID=UPI00194E1302|nr:ADYC domain-containing protein [Archangium violaceum]QRN99359.1 hypothetical protein JRI60_10210 [Archangium violaceum]